MAQITLALAFALLVASGLYLARIRASLRNAQRAGDALRRANEDLRALFEFAGGFAAQAHDTRKLSSYVQSSLGRITGGRVQVTGGGDDDAGAIRIEGGDLERWGRLRGAVEPCVAAAFRSATHAEGVHRTQLETIAALSRSMKAKERELGGDSERVSEIAVGLARRLGYAIAELNAIEIGALMHDVGKIGIPDSILRKPGPLDDDEWIVMKRHPVISELILSEAELPPLVAQIARSSHERIDGLGYPDGLVGDEIPLPARIVLVADAFAALTRDRPYRRARRPRAALAEIVANKDTQFCPKVVAALERLYVEEPTVLGEAGLTVVASAQAYA